MLHACDAPPTISRPRRCRTLEQDPGYLQRLTEHEKKEENRLLAEVAQYYEWVHDDHSPIPGPVGGFDKSWTFYEGDREAAGVGAA